MRNRLLALPMLVVLAACQHDATRGLDANPETPELVEFGLVAVGQKRLAPIPVGNSGAIALTVEDSTSDEPFVVSDLPGPVDPGSSGDVQVVFTPISAGEVSGTVRLISTSLVRPSVAVRVHGVAYEARLALGPNRLDFGDVLVGDSRSLTFDITNNSPVGLAPVLEPSEPRSEFAFSPQGALDLLEQRQAVTITVSFSPEVAGQRTTHLLLSCPICRTQELELTGNGLPPILPIPDAGTPDAGTPDAGTADAGTPDAGPAPACTLTATPSAVDFGALLAGQYARQLITYSATGTGKCFVELPYRDPTTDKSITVDSLVPFTLAPGDSRQFTAHFDPIASTPAQVSGALLAVSNDRANSPTTVSFSGVVTSPPPPPPPHPPGKLAVTPESLTFVAQVPAAPPSQNLTLKNTGGQELSWNAGSDDGKTTLSVSSGKLVPGASASVTVSVAAESAAGSRGAHLRIDAGSAGLVIVPVSITFTAAPPPPPAAARLVVSPLRLDFKAEAPGAPAAQSISIGNSGGLSLDWTASCDDAAVTTTPATGTEAGGASSFASVEIAAQPFSGKRSASLTINAGAAGKAVVAITIEFTAPPPPPPPPQYGASVWPKFHQGNTNSGLSSVDTSGNKGVLRWRKFLSLPTGCIKDTCTSNNLRCGTNVGSPVLLEDGTVIQLGGDGNVFALYRTTGNIKWKTMTAPPWLSANEGTPTVVKDGSIFQMTAGESRTKPQFYKLKSSDGSIVWNNTPGGQCGREACDGYDSSPALGDDGTLYEADDDYGRIVAFDQRGVEQSHVFLNPKDDIETLSGALAPDNIGYWSANGRLWAITPSKQLWFFSVPGVSATDDFPPLVNSHNVKSAPTVTADGKVIFTYSRRTSAFKQTTTVHAFKAGPKLVPLWSKALPTVLPTPGLSPGPGIAADDADALHYRSGITSPAVGPDGTIYIGHADGFYALKGDTGAIAWGWKTSEVVSSPAVGKDGTVYVGSMDGNIYAFRPDGTIRWQYQTTGQVNSSPAIGADGTIFAMSDDGYLYAIK